MPFNREIWKGQYSCTSFPIFPCPCCQTGTIALDGDSLSFHEPSYLIKSHSHPDWNPEWEVKRFAGFLLCNNATCGERVALIGETNATYVMDEEVGWCLESMLVPKGMFPAPSLIDIPGETPRSVRSEIKLAFQVYWVDVGASANRIRTSVERILDDLKIPTEAKNKSGSTYRLDLSRRIAEYQKIDSNHAETMDALRYVGNVGTHEANMSRDTLLDAFQIYEDTLAELYGKRSATIRSLKQKIIEAKGRY